MEGLHRSTERETSGRAGVVPASAEVRAILLRLVAASLHPDARSAWVARFGEPPLGFMMVPLREYIERVEAAALLTAPTLGAGLAQLHAQGVKFLLAQPAAALFVRESDRTPARLLERLETSRSLLASYGEWRVTREGPRSMSIEVRDEYVWLEHVWMPLLASVFPACGTQGEVECELDGPFGGRFRARW